jgi:hypothetical protein
MDSPREVFLSACADIAESLKPLGFKFAKSGPHALRKDGGFTYRIWFQSSHMNVVGAYVALWIHVKVLSTRLQQWRKSQPYALRTDDYVAGGQIGNLVPQHGWRNWNLADSSSRRIVITDAIQAVHGIAVPYFRQFENIPALVALLQREDLPAMHIVHALEFLLCFADVAAAERAMHRFLRSRAALLPQYHDHLREFQKAGFPAVRRTGFAYELAVATFAYGLTPASSA